MLRLAAVVVIAAIAANAPIVSPMSSRRPQASNQQTEQTAAPDQGDRSTSTNPGVSPASPLYVKAACEHGCGYAEDEKDLLQKVWTDPVAAFTGVLALFTLGLIGVGTLQWRATNRTNRHFEVTERAYLRMSHVTPKRGKGQALTFVDGVPTIRVQIKNWGRTPARVLAICLETDVRGPKDDFPLIPQFKSAPKKTEIFLVPGASFYFTPPFDPVDVPAIEDEERVLRTFGYVDYKDRFGNCHRSYYGRILTIDPKSPENNLAFITQGGYNDDVPLPKV